MGSLPFGFSRFPWGAVIKAAAVGAVLCVLPPLFVLVFSDGPHLVASLQKLSKELLILCSFMVLAAWLCHSLRVQLLVRTLGYRCSWRYAVATALAMEFGIAVTPGGVGGGAFKAAFLRKLGMPLSESIGLIATDILFDGFFLGAAAIAGLSAVGSDPRWQNILASLSLSRLAEELSWLVTAVAAVVLIGLYWARKTPLRLKGSPDQGHHGGGLGSEVRRLDGFGEAIRRGWRVAPRLFRENATVCAVCILLAFLQGSCRYGILPLLVHSFGPTVSVLPLVPIQALLWALSLGLVAPGGGGSVEIISLVFLRTMLPGESVAIVVLAWRFLTYHLNWIVGSVAFLGGSARSLFGSEERITS